MNTANLAKGRQINILGGGFSGLISAFFLVRQGFQVRIFEKKSWGGLISTKITPQMQIESAANGFLNSALLQDVAKEIGCELLPTLKQARKRFVFRAYPRRWPIGIQSTFCLIVFVWRFLWTRVKVSPQSCETIETWALRTLNREILDYLIAPGLQGIYAGDIQRLSATLILQRFFFKKKKQSRAKKFKRGSVAPPGGMGEFINALKMYLETKGVQFIFQELKDLQPLSRPLLLALPHYEAARLLDSDWNLVETLGLIRVSIGIHRPKEKIDGFGILFPQLEKFSSLGVLANSNIFPNRGELYNESWILGGALSPGLLDKSDAQILELICQDRKRALGVADEIMICDVVRWPKALPHYTVELEKLLSNYQCPEKDIYLNGNYLGQLGLSQILERSYNLAQVIKEKYG